MVSHYKNILVAIDINADYQIVIDKALSICRSPEELSLLYVPLPMACIEPYFYGESFNVIDDSTRLELANKKLEDIAKEFGLNEKKIILTLGDAGDEIKRTANQINADLIVIGTHGQSGFKLLLGSTANSVLHGVKQDVLAVRIYNDV